MAQEHFASATVRPSPDTLSRQVMLDLLAYQTDLSQRSVLYLDTLRQRAENMLEHERAGQPPLLYGNCQAGWAVALLSADCEGLVGPAVLNGSPLSYWSGESGVNPMRLAGGLLGGAWVTHLAADLGDGRFDGAHLAANFESLKPASTLWQKDYQLFADVEGKRERFWGLYDGPFTPLPPVKEM